MCICILVASSSGLNEPHIFFGIGMVATFAFFMANWMEFHAHISATRVGELGVTETQLLVVFFLMFNGLTGYSLFSLQIIKGWTLGDVVYGGFAYPFPFFFLYGLMKIKKDITDFKMAFLRFVPLVFMLSSLQLLANVEEYLPYKGWILIGYGFYVSLVTCKFIING